jgi:chorismate mutase/prephenate dehydratase
MRPRARTKAPAEPPSIESLRSRIDEINLKILRLLAARGNIVTEIGRLKHSTGQMVYQPGRERAVIDKMIAENPGPLSADHVRRIYTEIISAGRALERVARIAFLGPEHTYSHDAARMHFGSSVEFMPLPSFAQVFAECESDRADFGVVPVENSTDGSVRMVLDLLIDTPLVIIGEILMPIKHCILARGGDLKMIKKIVSHEQSIAQCRGWLAANMPDIPAEAVASNSLAAQMAGANPELGAIASRTAGEAYGLAAIAENIQDLATNTTRFLVMGRTAADRSGADRTTILFATADRVGALNEALGMFARNRINISKIESRPLRSRPWEYMFFLDLGGHCEDPPMARALASLKRKALFLKVLGSYPEGRTAAL